ncbi:MAG: fatty acid desaturase [Alphaproteobacteria bacterium]
MSSSVERDPAVLTDPVSANRAGQHFYQSFVPEPHYGRTRAILAQHPEVRDLVGRNPWTLAIIIFACGAQIAGAWLLSAGPWWAAIIAAYLVGAFFTHALWAMIHECVHCRVLGGTIPNRLAGILANLTMVVPTSTSFEKYHLRHHIYQGVYQNDADLPREWEVKLFGGTRLGRFCWMLVFPILLMFRTSKMDGALWDRWLTLNFAAVIAFDVAVLVFLGPVAFLYLAMSMLFALGLHPLGARWIQEHFTGNPDQETYSYYGPLNRVQLNIGFHNEHHDFPGVPWNKLPALKRLAAESYDSLESHQSWSKLLYDFGMSGNPDISGRVVRSERRPKTAEAPAA